MMHETEKIPIKFQEVDKEIIPLIQWFNSIEDVYTRYSCQGDEKYKEQPNINFSLPYISFFCDWEDSLKKIKQLVFNVIPLLDKDEAITWEIITDYCQDRASSQYILRMSSIEVLKKFVNKINKEN